MSAPVVVCYYSNSMVQMATWVLSTPLLISGILSVIGWLFGVFTLVCYSGFLFTMDVIFLAIQSGLHMEFEDPMCPGHILPGPPCIPGFYVASLFTMVICYYILLWKRPGSVYILFLVLVIIGLPLILIWFSYFSFWDVFVMIYIGIFSTLIFFWFMMMYILPEMHFMFSNSVIGWFQYTDRMFLTKTQIELSDQDLLVTRLLQEQEENKRKLEKEEQRFYLPEWGTG